MDESCPKVSLELISDQLAELIHHVAEVRKSNQRLEKRMDVLDARMEHLEVRVTRLEQGMEQLNCRVMSLEQGMEQLRCDVGNINSRLTDLENTFATKMDRLIGFVGRDSMKAKYHIEEELNDFRDAYEKRLCDVESMVLQRESTNSLGSAV